MTNREAPALRVLRIIARLNMGGPARHVILLDEGLMRRGHETLLAHGSLDDGEGSLEYLATEYAVPVTRIPGLGRRIRLMGDLRAFLRILAILFREQPDVVHTHTAKAGTLGRLAALVFNATRSRRRRCLVVHTFHGHVLEGYFHPVGDRAVRLAERLLASVTDRVVAISRGQHRDLVERFGVARGGRTETIPLGLDLGALLRLSPEAPSPRDHLGIPAGSVVVGYVGRMVPIKNLPLLVEAFAHAAAARDDLWLVLTGDGPLRPALEALVERLGIAARVRFAGWTDDLPRIYQSMDICALASENEGTPVTLIEAMASARAVVATRVGGVPDVVEDGVTGLLVPPRNVAAFAAALLTLASDGDRRQRFGLAGRRLADERYSVDRLVDTVERLYRTALSEKRDGAAIPSGNRSRGATDHSDGAPSARRERSTSAPGVPARPNST